MTYKGHVENSRVVVDGGIPLPNGTQVIIQPVDSQESGSDMSKMTMNSVIGQFAGSMHGLPPDFAENHDHYIHGTEKK